MIRPLSVCSFLTCTLVVSGPADALRRTRQQTPPDDGVRVHVAIAPRSKNAARSAAKKQPLHDKVTRRASLSRTAKETSLLVTSPTPELVRTAGAEFIPSTGRVALELKPDRLIGKVVLPRPEALHVEPVEGGLIVNVPALAFSGELAERNGNATLILAAGRFTMAGEYDVEFVPAADVHASKSASSTVTVTMARRDRSRLMTPSEAALLVADMANDLPELGRLLRLGRKPGKHFDSHDTLEQLDRDGLAIRRHLGQRSTSIALPLENGQSRHFTVDDAEVEASFADGR